MRTLALAALAVALALPASAATLDLFTTGAFTGTQGGRAVQGVGTDAITWGQDCRSCTGRSGYSIGGYSGSKSGADDSFRIGSFTHDNAAIRAGSGITGADLSLSFTGSLAGQAFSYSDALSVAHVESPNGPCGKAGCADTVSFGGFDPWSFSASDGEGTWTLTLLGFGEPGSAPEGGSQEVGLFAALKFIAAPVVEVPEPPAPVPVPASLGVLAVALGALGAVRRRRG